MRMIVLAAASALVFSGAELSAQQAPDLSGSWTLAEGSAPQGGAARGGRGGMGGGPGGGMMAALGQEAVITQDAATLTIVRSTQMGEIRTVYQLDGSESRNRMAMGSNQVELVSRAAWESGKLVITTHIPGGRAQGESRMTLSLEDGKLVVENSRPGGMGGGGSTRAVYAKK